MTTAALLQRPVAVLLSCFLLVLLGVAALRVLPVSLLPDVEVPRMTVQLRLSGTAAEVMENTVVRPLRGALARTSGLKDIRSIVSDGQGFIYLGFEYGADMDRAYLEVNERIDQAMGFLPREMPRPVVMRSSVSDIPIFQLQVVPEDDGDIAVVSTLVDQVIRRKLEQIPGVSLIDINGLHTGHVLVRPNRELLHVLGISEGQILQALRLAGQEYGTFPVKNGHYQYFVRLENMDQGLAHLGELPLLSAAGRYQPLSSVAEIRRAESFADGYHLYNGKKALGIQICKQADARMDRTAPQIRAAVQEMRRAHPQASFFLTRDQSFLLNSGINNLYQVIGYGALLSVGILFIFMGNFMAGVVVGLSIPISLLVTFVLFRLCGLSLNILSLSGLALGVGMLIDHSIIVLDVISRKAGQGLAISEACAGGAREVHGPVLGQTLTSVAIYGPLILLPGMAGMLIFDQALALSLCLGVSLLVAFILLPLLCRMLLAPGLCRGQSETRFFLWLLSKYHLFYKRVASVKRSLLLLAGLFVLSAGWTFFRIPVEGMPEMDKTETLLELDWGEPITAAENLRRIQSLDTLLARMSDSREAEVGPLQYLLSAEGQTAQEAQVYYRCRSSVERLELDRQASFWVERHFPLARVKFEAAPNALNQIFSGDGPFFEARIRTRGDSGGFLPFQQIYTALSDFPLQGFRPGRSAESEEGISLYFDPELMAIHHVSKEVLLSKLGALLGGRANIRLPGEAGTVLQVPAAEGFFSRILEEGIRTPAGEVLPLSHFVRYSGSQMPGRIVADQSGPYFSLELEKGNGNMRAMKEDIAHWAQKHGLEVQFSGRYIESGEQVRTLAKIGALALLLLYFILALQFDHLLLPLVIMSALGFGVAGAIWLLYLSGSTLNIMSGIGFVVVLGIILDDPILKIEVIQQHRAKLEGQGIAAEEAIERALEFSGSICLKPMLMTTLTTCLALVPVFFSSGVGAELQRPLALVVIGGLMVGTFFTSWCIPLIYAAVMRNAVQRA